MLYEKVRRGWVAILSSQVLQALLLTPRVPQSSWKPCNFTPPSSSKDAVCRLGLNRRRKIQSPALIIYGFFTLEFVYLLKFICNPKSMPLALLKSLADSHKEVKSIFGFSQLRPKVRSCLSVRLQNMFQSVWPNISFCCCFVTLLFCW